MKYLSKLPPEVQSLVISLPFRVGLFISESDQTGGDESAVAERKALENIVTFYVEDTVKGEFAHEVMLETLNNRSNWDGWSQNIGKVPEECLNVTYMLKDFIDAREILAYKQNLIEVGIVVAQAYCELNENSSIVTKLEAYISLFMKKLQMKAAGEVASSVDHTLNISASERAAIKLLCNNLDVQVNF